MISMYDIYKIEGTKHLRKDTKEKKENEFLKESIFANSDFSGLCVKNGSKVFYNCV